MAVLKFWEVGQLNDRKQRQNVATGNGVPCLTYQMAQDNY